MRLRPAVLQIPAKSSVPPGLPIHKVCLTLTRPESTLPQLLIPLHFNSPRMNTYTKPGGGPLSEAPKYCKLVTTHASLSWSRRNFRNSIRFMPLLHDLRTPGGGGTCGKRWSSLQAWSRQPPTVDRGSRTGRGSQLSPTLSGLFVASLFPRFVASFFSATIPPHPGATHA